MAHAAACAPPPAADYRTRSSRGKLGQERRAGVGLDLDTAHDVVQVGPTSIGSVVMSTPASSLNWWYIDGSRLWM